MRSLKGSMMSQAGVKFRFTLVLRTGSLRPEMFLRRQQMKNRTLSKGSVVLFSKIVLVASVLFIFGLSPVLSIAESPEHWISMAENSCIYDKSYTVDRKTEVYKQAGGSRDATRGTLVETGNARLLYTKQRGLRIEKGGFNSMSSQERTDMTSSLSKPSPFTLDVGHMLQKMKGKVQWVLEDENTLLDGQACVVLSSSGDKWLVRLWIRKGDGVVLRYDQHLNDKFIGTSLIEYSPPMDGKYLPLRTSTRFYLTGDSIVQEYDKYSFPEDEQ